MDGKRAGCAGCVAPTILFAVVLAGAVVPAPLWAQAGDIALLQRWDLGHLRGAWCLSFLMEPGKAADELPDGFLPVPIQEVKEVHPAIRRTSASEAQYSSWIPSRVCLYHFDTVTVDSQYEFTEDELDDMNETQTFGVWGIAARGAGAGDTAVAYFIRDFRVRDGSLRSVAEQARIRIDGMDVELELLPDSVDYRYQYGVAETNLMWDGHLASDTAWAVEPIEHRWVVRTMYGSLIPATLTFRPESRHYMVGILSTQGDEELAEALNASPIRMVGPMYLEGGGSLVFQK